MLLIQKINYNKSRKVKIIMVIILLINNNINLGNSTSKKIFESNSQQKSIIKFKKAVILKSNL